MSKEPGSKEMIGGCCVCSDEFGSFDNPLVYCDGSNCSVAVHKACYGIVEVPKGPWFCRKCESQERIARVKCELCPQRAGALKRTDAGGWCHVVCALYIPEAWFANVLTMEPIVLSSVPAESFEKVCYICEEQNKDTKARTGACMKCNRGSCKQYFHVTCAQVEGLLCEVTSNTGAVTYIGFCSYHYKKQKNNTNVKAIPAFKPIQSEGTPVSSPEKQPPNIIKDQQKLDRLAALAEVASPGSADQSVSSTSDVPPALTCSDPHDRAATSARPTPAPTHSDLPQEPSSSMSAVEAARPPPALSPTTQHEPLSHQVAELDVGGPEPAPPPGASNTPLSTSDSKKSGGRKSSRESNSKKNNSNSSSISSSRKSASGASGSSSSSRAASSKDKKSSSSAKRRRDSANSQAEVKPEFKIDPTPTPSFTGQADFTSAVFGGNPFFQPLASPVMPLPGSPFSSDFASVPKDPPPFLPTKCFPSQQNKNVSDHSKSKVPQTLEDLLEHQWDASATFLASQPHTLDIASYLRTLYRIKNENKVLEDEVKALELKRDQLLRTNAGLSLPLEEDTTLTGATSKRSSIDSLEDISSPDDTQASSSKVTAPSLLIPAQPSLIVEDILSPAAEQQQAAPPVLRCESPAP